MRYRRLAGKDTGRGSFSPVNRKHFPFLIAAMRHRRYIVSLKILLVHILNLSGGAMKFSIFLAAVALVALCLCLGGCKTLQLPTGKGYTDLCQTYVGHDSTTLVDSWGGPGRTFNAPNDQKVFVYVETKSEYSMNPLAHSALIEYPPNVDGRKSGPGEVTPTVVGQSVPAMDYCITYFEVNKQNQVWKVYWKGDCKSLEKTQTE